MFGSHYFVRILRNTIVINSDSKVVLQLLLRRMMSEDF